MCRWVAYHGKPVFLEDFITLPCQSLIAQSHRAREAKTEVNADGFGIGWYGERPRPGVFRDIRPAWSDDNLLSMAHQIRSRLFLAHVRASTGTATTRANCHPFSVGEWMFMHNGQIGGYPRLRRRLEMAIPEALYEHRTGTTDSEALFLLAIAANLGADPKGALETTLGAIEAEMEAAGITEPLKITAAMTDGSALYAVRYSTDAAPPTLYTRDCCQQGGTLVVSEPLDDVRGGWSAVPPQCFVKVASEVVEVSEFHPTRGRALAA